MDGSAFGYFTFFVNFTQHLLKDVLHGTPHAGVDDAVRRQGRDN